MGGKLRDKVVVGGAVSIKIKEVLDEIAKLRNINRSKIIEEALTQYVKGSKK